MERYNSFLMIHKALRAMLYETASIIQQTNFADPEQSELVVEKIDMILYSFEQHARHEDISILPLLEIYEHQLVVDFEQEHLKDGELGNRLKHLLNIFNTAETAADKVFCGSFISKSFVEFMIFNLEHMAREEMLINQALWKHYTDEQLIMNNQKMVAAIPAEEKILISTWMIRAANDIEVVNWLKDVRNSAPDFIFQSLLSLTESELPEQRRKKIHRSVLVKPVLHSEPELLMA